MFAELDTPSVLVDIPTLRRNIQNMVAGLSTHGIAHRPHFKAHKSLYIARMQMAAGACGMTCAKLGEAEVLVDGGITDIFIAFPITGTIKLQRLVALFQRATLRVLINSLEAAQAMSEAFVQAGNRIKVLIELEGGMGRSGWTLENIADMAKEVNALPGLELVGIMSYHGTVYGMNTTEDFIAHTKQESADLLSAQSALRDIGIDVSELSGGSSFTGKFPQYITALTEVRAGNYVFNDIAQLSTGLVTERDCAMTVLCTVVTLPDDRHAVVDAGSKTFSSDTTKFGQGYGRVMGSSAMVYKLSEEHGYLELPERMRLEVGQRLRIIPNHACVLPNLAEMLIGVGEGVPFEIAVEARGKNK